MRIIDERGLVYDTNPNELYHHGILGMKWGVRHDHYPLNASEHTAAEKKAGYKKSIGGRNENLYGRKVKKANKISDKYDKKIGYVVFCIGDRMWVEYNFEGNNVVEYVGK